MAGRRKAGGTMVREKIERDPKTGRPLTPRQKAALEREKKRKKLEEQRKANLAKIYERQQKQKKSQEKKARIITKQTKTVVSHNGIFTRELIGQLCEENDEFRSITESGKYKFADKYMYLYHPSLIQTSGKPHVMILSEDVVNNPDEYSLSFTKNAAGNITFHHPANYEAINDVPFDPEEYVKYYDSMTRLSNHGGNNGNGNGTGFDDGDGSDFEGSFGNGGGPPTPPPENRLKKIIMDYINDSDESRNSVNKLAKYLHIAPETISRFWTRPNARPQIESVIAVCIGLNMIPEDSEIVLHLCGYCLRAVPQERAYRTLINALYFYDIVQANQYLLKRGLTAMTSAT